MSTKLLKSYLIKLIASVLCKKIKNRRILPNSMVTVLMVHVAASWSSGRVQDSGLGSRSSPGFNTPPVRPLVVPPEQGASRCIASFDPGANGYLWGQICKPWRQVACERLYTPRGVEMDIQMDIWIVKAQWPGKVLVKVCRAELCAWMWTQNSDFTFFTLHNSSVRYYCFYISYIIDFAKQYVIVTNEPHLQNIEHKT